jgi:four helix bundle protein
MSSLSHESLNVYQQSIQFVAWTSCLITEKQITGVLLDQFKRAFISVPLNIAEGSGKFTGKDQAKFYDIARGSALECGACLDVLVAMEGAETVDVAAGKEVLVEVVAMLTGLSRSVASDRVREEGAVYGEGEVEV